MPIGDWLGRFFDIDRPTFVHGLNIEAFSQDPDLAPRVPVRGNYDLVAVDDVVF